MRLYIDSADISAIKEALASGYVYGVTTNPTILRRAGVRAAGIEDLARAALDEGAQELHLQVYSEDVPGMLREADMLTAIDPLRVVVKIPATAAGYAAAVQLTWLGTRVTLTAVYTVRQAVLAQAARASYIAVYLGRMSDAGLDALDVVGRIQRVFDRYGGKVEILAASVRTPEEIESLAELGVATATLPADVLRRLLDSPHTAAAAEAFAADVREIG